MVSTSRGTTKWTHIHKNNGKCFGGKEQGTIREHDGRHIKRW